jgi:hypothetical protein
VSLRPTAAQPPYHFCVRFASTMFKIGTLAHIVRRLSRLSSLKLPAASRVVASHSGVMRSSFPLLSVIA